MGITLWIVPSAKDTERLKKIMAVRPQDSLPVQTSSVSYPIFDPHITLASLSSHSNILLSKLKESIPKTQSALKVNFKSVDAGDHFFRSVYIAVTPTSELTALHQHVHEALGVEPRTPMFPHISLCYISDHDAEHGERQRFRDELRSTGRIREDEGGAVSLNCGTDKEDWVSGFISPEIWIADCEGPLESWRVLERIPLNSIID
ncbi:cyclic phosphodiesterase [Moniliophthora roreri]|nr:cyclic phosphodiesterase [Moniliophthora roreri]